MGKRSASMSDMATIVHFADRPRELAGLEWYEPEDGGGSVLVARGERSPDEIGEAAGSVLSVWHGARILNAGSGRRGEVVYLLKFPVPEEYATEFDAWYRFEHVPLLLEEPAWYACELFRSTCPSAFSFASLHYLESRAVLNSEARKRSRATPWWNRLARNDWWDHRFERMLLRPLRVQERGVSR